MVENFKMAAELETLLSSYTSETPERYSFILFDCLESRQLLQDHNCTASWIAKVNSLLNSRNERWLGLSLLGLTVEQCDTDSFTANCVTWLKAIQQILQSPKESAHTASFCSKTVDQILQNASQFSELSRELSTSVIPPLVTALLSKKIQSLRSVFGVLTSCINHFPGPVGPFRNRIENFLLPHLESNNEEIRKAACVCFAMLPRCGGSGTEGKKHGASWEVQWRKLVNSIHKTLNSLYECVTGRGDHSSQSENVLPLGLAPEVEPRRTSALLTQLQALTLCLNTMLCEGFPKAVNIPLDEIIELLCKGLAVTDLSMKNAVTIESVLLKASLPTIHSWMFALLSTLILRCGNHLLPHCMTITRLCVQELSWTSGGENRHGHSRPFGQLRCAVYSCIDEWSQQTGIVCDSKEILTKIVSQMVEDIKPQASQTKLLKTTDTRQPKSKKAKKRKIQEDVEQLLAGQQKSDTQANAAVTTQALKALCSVIVVSGSDIPPDLFKDVQATVIKLLISCQRSTSPKSYPLPYSSPECRHHLYRVLQCCTVACPAAAPSAVQFSVKLFSTGLRDGHPTISSFCREALAVCLAVIHPRVPSRGTPSDMSTPLDSTQPTTNKPQTPLTNWPQSEVVLDSCNAWPGTGRLDDTANVKVSEQSEETATESLRSSTAFAGDENGDSIEVLLSKGGESDSRKREQTVPVSAPLKYGNVVLSTTTKSGQEMQTSELISDDDGCKESRTEATYPSVSVETSTTRATTTEDCSTDADQQDELAQATRMSADQQDEPLHAARVTAVRQDEPPQSKRLRVETANGVDAAPSRTDPEIHKVAETDQMEIVPDPDGNSDEALKMLEAFVESYPDSDDQEMS